MKRSIKFVAIGGVIVVALAGFGFWYWFIRDTAPPPAELTVRSTVAPTSAGPDGDYSVQEGADTFAGLRINEQFTVGDHTAVMQTPAVTGALSLDGTQITGVTITADLTQLENKDDAPPGVPGLNNRINAIQNDGLQVSQFPNAKFEQTDPITLPSEPKVGETVTVNAKGKLTLHGVTKDVTIPIKARWNGELIDVNGSLPIVLADYSMTPPSRGFVSVADNGTMEFNLTFAK